MAEKPASERTEEPTEERLRRAREEGRVPTSQEVPSAVVIGGLLVALAVAAPGLYHWFASQVVTHLAWRPAGDTDTKFFSDLMTARMSQSLTILVPFLIGGAAASICASLVSSGWAISAKPVRLDFERISPVAGFKRLLSLRSVVHLLVSLAKLAVICLIVWMYLRDKVDSVVALWQSPLDATVLSASQIVLGVLLRIVLGLSVIAAIDLLYQRWTYRRDLRMTRQELKEERKQYELSPEIKGRMRAIQMEMTRKRTLDAVPNADVVLANPTHVAVAIRYDSADMDAPTVIAKGPDLLAQQMKDVARKHGIPVVHRPELARAIYRSVDVGKGIPETLFVAVAEVLAMIYRLKKQP